ncbi:DUF368 domain-containing protein [Candidatus Venteria ishoeyi]|uniref:DUF368 domain-containing protein n=1 Tax=Candidatus Venteria ishoeyi TaxID=1899563 RepID=A0A1H6FDP6_9GAMM|nr:DUF368 domain-containing protein [Candidatus Venteria ishoeyi]SEH07155.1 Uncharacterised protein [Candidatus Venteria ishoeyi]
MSILKFMQQRLDLVWKGFLWGAADVVPGVSGGTMALVLGIYERWLAAIRSFDRVWLQHIMHFNMQGALFHPQWAFLLPLVLGIFAALMFFTRVIPLPEWLHTHPEAVYGLFFGLIVGSIITLLRDLQVEKNSYWLFWPLGAVLGWFVVTSVPMSTPDTSWFIFISGFLAISAMLLPGISGSFILLILKKYDTILNGLGHFNLWIIVPFAFGAATGLVIFSRVLGWLLGHYHTQALLSIIGVLTASLWVIWPFQERTYALIHNKEKLISTTPYFPKTLDSTLVLSMDLMVVGLLVVVLLHHYSSKPSTTMASSH